MKIFISHKQEDEYVAKQIAKELESLKIDYYLDVLDNKISSSGQELTNHIKLKLNDCSDIIVVMSENTRLSQWVFFEVGMSAQIDMPTAAFLQDNVSLPDFLVYWPRLKQPIDIQKYVEARRSVKLEYFAKRAFESSETYVSQTARFYEVLKQKLQ